MPIVNGIYTEPKEQKAYDISCNYNNMYGLIRLMLKLNKEKDNGILEAIKFMGMDVSFFEPHIE
jgi:prolipoprotein diacylglyceryltransferase